MCCKRLNYRRKIVCGRRSLFQASYIVPPHKRKRALCISVPTYHVRGVQLDFSLQIFFPFFFLRNKIGKYGRAFGQESRRNHTLHRQRLETYKYDTESYDDLYCILEKSWPSNCRFSYSCNAQPCLLTQYTQLSHTYSR
jgi:hypothetical protein